LTSAAEFDSGRNAEKAESVRVGPRLRHASDPGALANRTAEGSKPETDTMESQQVIHQIGRAGSNTAAGRPPLNGASDPAAMRDRAPSVDDPIPNPFMAVDPVLLQDFRNLASAYQQPRCDFDGLRNPPRPTADRATIDVPWDMNAGNDGEARESVHESGPEASADASTDIVAQARPLGDTADERLQTSPEPEPTGGLDRSDPGHWSRASRLRLVADLTAGAAFSRIVLHAVSHLTANHDCARLNLHVEGVHQCRIALRRLRSAFKIYKPLLRCERIESIEDTVRWLGAILGAARDLDVLQTQLLAPALEALGKTEQLAPLMAGLEDRTAAAYRAVGEALGGKRYHHLLVELRALGHADDLAGPDGNGFRLDQPVVGLASSALSRAHQKLLKRGSGFETLSETKRHDVRIALKRLRYALDFFSTIFEGGSKKRFVKRVARLQDDLGRMNDIAVADTMLAQLVGIAGDGSGPAVSGVAQRELAFAAGGILGWHRRGAAEINRRLVTDWYAFVRAKPFWLGRHASVT
jgi:triphosphatase